MSYIIRHGTILLSLVIFGTLITPYAFGDGNVTNSNNGTTPTLISILFSGIPTLISGIITAVLSLTLLWFYLIRASREDRGYMKIKLECSVINTSNSPPSPNHEPVIIAKTSVENTSRRHIIIQTAYLIISESETSFLEYYDCVQEKILHEVDNNDAITRSKSYIRKLETEDKEKHKKEFEEFKKTCE